MTYRFSNRASALITNSLSATSTSVILETNGGALFPFLAVGQVCQAALVSTTATEYVTITAIVGDNLTIQRAQEGSAASSFAAGSRLELRLTANVMDNMLQRTGGTLLGDIDFNGHQALNLEFPSVIRSYQYYGTIFSRITQFGPFDGTDNSIIIPDDDTQPYIRGRRIMTANYFDQIVFSAFIDVNNPPAHMVLCDGNNSTPDLRRLFLRGWNPGELQVGTAGGADIQLTDPQGTHGHANTTFAVALNSTTLPDLVVSSVVQNNTEINSVFSRVTSVSVTYNNATARNHAHGIVNDGVHQHNVIVAPPYAVVAFVVFRNL